MRMLGTEVSAGEEGARRRLLQRKLVILNTKFPVSVRGKQGEVSLT